LNTFFAIGFMIMGFHVFKYSVASASSLCDFEDVHYDELQSSLIAANLSC